jgi:hypothetical protein
MGAMVAEPGLCFAQLGRGQRCHRPNKRGSLPDFHAREAASFLGFQVFSEIRVIDDPAHGRPRFKAVKVSMITNLIE